jgi:hypothetical protein
MPEIDPAALLRALVAEIPEQRLREWEMREPT